MAVVLPAPRKPPSMMKRIVVMGLSCCAKETACGLALAWHPASAKPQAACLSRSSRRDEPVVVVKIERHLCFFHAGRNGHAIRQSPHENSPLEVPFRPLGFPIFGDRVE